MGASTTVALSTYSDKEMGLIVPDVPLLAAPKDRLSLAIVSVGDVIPPVAPPDVTAAVTPAVVKLTNALLRPYNK